MKRYLISSIVTAIAAGLSAAAVLLLQIDWSTLENPKMVFASIFMVLELASRTSVKVFTEALISKFTSKE